MFEYSDQTLLIYDEEQETSPKFFKQMLVDFMDETSYTCDIMTFDGLTAFINDLQWSEGRSFQQGGKDVRCFIEVISKKYL